MTSALVVVDVQNDFVSGSLAVPGADIVAASLAELLDGPTPYDVLVATRDYHAPTGDNGGHFGTDSNGGVDFAAGRFVVHCVKGTYGAELHPSLRSSLLVTFDKGYGSPSFSGFDGVSQRGASLHDYLRMREVDEIDVCGLAFDYCVAATARDGARLGYRTSVLTDLTASVDASRYADVAADLTSRGVLLA